MKWFHIVLTFLPAILSMFKPELGPIGGGIAIAVTEAEQIWGPGTGPQKLQHVLNATQAAAATLNLAEGRTVVDPATLADAVTKGLDVGIDMVNIFAKKMNAPVVTPAA